MQGTSSNSTRSSTLSFKFQSNLLSKTDLMRSICILTQSFYEFDARVRRKAEALAAAGYSVDALALATPNGRKTYTLNGVKVRTISLAKKRGSLFRYFFEYTAFFFWAFVRVFLQMRQRRYAVIDVNTLPDFLIFAAAPARWIGAKLILDMHEITPEFYMSKYRTSENSWLIRLVKYLEKISFQYADHVITINEPICDLLVRRGLSPSKSIVVMNSASEERFASIGPGPGAKGHSDSFVIMYHGTLTQIYGLDIAIKAFGMAQAEMPGAELWILGATVSKSEQDPLARLVHEYGLTAKVKLFELVPSAEIPAWLNKCDVGILPLRGGVFFDFAFPNKLPEFVIMGKPVLMSRVKTIRYYFSEEALAYFDPNDPADLAQQMIRLYGDRSLCARLAARAKEEYTPIRWDVMKQRYLNLVGGLSDSGDCATEGPYLSETTILNG